MEEAGRRAGEQVKIRNVTGEASLAFWGLSGGTENANRVQSNGRQAQVPRQGREIKCLVRTALHSALPDGCGLSEGREGGVRGASLGGVRNSLVVVVVVMVVVLVVVVVLVER